MKRFFSLLFTVTSTAIAVGLAQPGRTQTNWADADAYFSLNELETIANENMSESLTDTDTIESMQAYELDNGLYMVDFNSRDLCGRMGCAYAIYNREGGQIDRVFSGYLNAAPEGAPLVEVIGTEREGLPCVRFNQNAGAGATEGIGYCYNGENYVIERGE